MHSVTKPAKIKTANYEPEHTQLDLIILSLHNDVYTDSSMYLYTILKDQ